AVVGSVSLTVTDRAMPWPLFFTVTVKPIPSPADTVPVSAVFVTAMSGHRTVTLALAVSSAVAPAASFVAAPFAVFATTPQLVALVVALTWTLELALAARSWGP